MKIVISAINIFQGGPLSILLDFCKAAQDIPEIQEIIVLCHRKELLKDFQHPKFKFMEYPISRKRWIFRIFYEYIYFYFLAKKLKPDFWLSLHDMTPNIGKICPQAVYCHNSSQFYNVGWKELYYAPDFFLFSKFYKYLYRINLKSNTYIILQQQWLREKFKSLYALGNNIIVASPVSSECSLSTDKESGTPEDKKIFFYPAFPRVFKNFEIICETARYLEHKGVCNIEFVITVDGTENRYAKDLVKKYKDCALIHFIGLQSRNAVFNLYHRSSALIFPSKLETWGLPISEYKMTGKPLFLADMEYAHETVGDYSLVSFFDPDNSRMLAEQIIKFLSNDLIFQSTHYENTGLYAQDMKEMITILLSSVNKIKTD